MAVQLSVEQQFSIRSFTEQVKEMGEEEVRSQLIILYEQMVIKEANYQQLLREKWGMGSSIEGI